MLTKIDAKQRIAKLKEQLWETDYAYYVEDKPIMSDAARDSLKDELEKLEKQWPEFITPDSPTQRIGGKALGKFAKIKHKVPKYSLDDVFSFAEVLEFNQRVKRFLNISDQEKVEYNVELKIDGLNMTFIYKKGILEKAVTRGDGVVGEDVTHTIRTVKTVPLRLKKPIDIEVGGEVYMPIKSFNKLNSLAKQGKSAEFANPRNAAAGTVRQLDPQVAATRDLQAFFYTIYDGWQPATQQEVLQYLQNLGFRVDKHFAKLTDISQAEKFFADIKKIRNRLAFEIDGIAIKVNRLDWQRQLGRTAKHVRWACAYKFAAQQATTKVRDIKIQVGRTGALTPVAILDPVSVSGSTVSRATLHNQDEINRLDVRIGDTVIIQKAGDVIPDIVKTLPKLRERNSSKFIFPKKCPVCYTPVTRKEGEVAYYCPNKKCYAKNIEGLIHFVSKPAFNIDGLGDKIIMQLVDQGLISNPADIWRLQFGDLSELEGFAKKKADNLLTAIIKAKKIALNKFIFALGIRHVGEETAIVLANHFRDFNKLQKASLNELQELDDIGPEVARSIVDWFNDKQNQKIFEDLLAVGIELVNPQRPSGKLAGQTFLFTGSLNLERAVAKQLVRDKGGKVLSGVSKQLDYLVVGDKPGSKLKKAEELKIKILTEEQFLKLMR